MDGYHARLTHAGVAAPFYFCHLASNDIDREGAVVADSAFFVLQRNGVVTRVQRNGEVPLIIGGKRRDHTSLIFDDERRVC